MKIKKGTMVQRRNSVTVTGCLKRFLCFIMVTIIYLCDKKNSFNHKARPADAGRTGTTKERGTIIVCQILKFY